MKKRIVLCLILVFLITGCSAQADYVGIPKGYVDKDEHYEQDGFQHYIDYAKYIYSSTEIIIDNNKYSKVTKEDIFGIKGYFEDFRDSMESNNRLNEYDFDEGIINEGDYIRIKTKEGEKIGDSKYEKYDDYSIYYFDIETHYIIYT